MRLDAQQATRVAPGRIRSACQCHVSGCLLGKPLEVLSLQRGLRGVEDCPRTADREACRTLSTSMADLVVDGGEAGCDPACCDNDSSELRENFVGSEPVPPGRKDRGWIDADLFGKHLLVETP